ncbi:HlyD family secretion protein [Mesorhizobium sp. M6A.T.Ce.TU.002.03.1.1]|uniref:HlyD family efflux transporter periplasmic adaptor subunit n=1 Tax=Mesorhizobium sp. M6A.T.Ce.TU.002.03.1.1 TaxID=2496782 RepID=UPI000FCAB943|nr:HlyD family secretion protein [Mesorhizobium sp. M6A.T.Ce.TU.002.03.1.1]RUU33679.1 HlyD family secretion protein [Mesorhizobium sp. M6A.T.Ce.TU.002.03.1.1]
MPLTAKVRSLRARASQSSDLSFNMAGVIAARNYDFTSGGGSAHLGKNVQHFDISGNLYSHLGETLPAGGGLEAGARLKFDGAAIVQLLSVPGATAPAPYLFALRNETLAAALNQAVAKRENAFLERYKHVAQTAARLRASYPEIVWHLKELLTKTRARFMALDAEYAGDAVGIRKSTTAVQTVSADYAVQTENVTTSTTLATWNAAMPNDAPVGTEIVTVIQDPGNTPLQKHAMPNSASLPRVRNAAGQWVLVDTPEFVSQKIGGTTTSIGQQLTSTPDPRYTHPRLDNEVDFHQSSQAVHGELIKQELASFRLAHIERIMANELEAIDLEIRALQLNLAHTYLLSPFDGVVTALYKDVGESIEAGEPVLRIENDAVLLLVGQLQAAGMVRLGAAVTIAFEEAETGVQRQLPGTVVSVRGHEADDDEWDIIVQTANPQMGASGRMVPLNYQFDPDSTVVTIA